MGKKSTPKQTTTSKTENNPWAPAQDQLKDILSEAQKQYEATGGLDGNWIDKNFPDLTPEMKASLGNLASSGQLNQVADNINKITSSASTNVNNASSALSGMTSGGITGQQPQGLQTGSELNRCKSKAGGQTQYRRNNRQHFNHHTGRSLHRFR